MKPILQYQSGGSVGSLFVDYEPFQGMERATTANVATSASGKGSSDEKSSGKAGLKDLLGLLKEVNALPVDLDALSSQIAQLYADATIFGNEMSQSDLVSTYLSALRLIGRADYNQKEYNEAKKEATANGGINEVAIDLRGHIFVQNQETGEILTVTPQEYGDLIQQGNYQALTNSNLLYLRGNDPNFAFKNDILTTVQNGIGIDKVTQMIMNIKNKIGETTLQQEGYSKQTTQQIMSGMDQLQKAQQTGMTIEGLYKQSIINSNQVQEAQMALMYIWNTLPANAKARLKVASAESGQYEDVEDGAINLINTLISSGLKTTQKYSLDLVKDPNATGNGSSGSGSGSGTGSGDDAKGPELDPAKGFVLGMGHSQEYVFNPGTSYQFRVIGREAPITDHAGNILGQYSTMQEVTSSSFGGILDFNNATFGGIRIESFNRAFLENGNAVGVDLPIDVAYLNRTGIIRPDFSLLSKIEQLNAAYRTGEVDPNNQDQVNRKCAELELPLMYSGLNEAGLPKLDETRYARFAKIDALVDENAFPDGQEVNEGLVREVSGKRRDTFKEYMKTKDKNYDLDEDFLFFGGGDDLYEGSIYIPVKSDIIAASYGGKYYKLPQDNAIRVAQKFADDQARQTYNPGPRYGEIQ